MSGLLAERHDRVVELVLDRPDAGNAFDTSLYEELASALADAADDPAVACVVLGATGRIFCAGVDLHDLAAALGGTATGRRGYERLLGVVEEFPKPLFAAVDGPAVGIGFTLLGHADVVLVSEKARFRAPFARLGLVPEAGSSATFPARLGPSRAAYLLFSGDWLSADDAVAWGLAVRKVPSDRLRAETLDLATRVAAQPVASLVATKRLLVEARGVDPAAARRREDAAFGAALGRAETAGLVRDALRTVTGEKA